MQHITSPSNNTNFQHKRFRSVAAQRGCNVQEAGSWKHLPVAMRNLHVAIEIRRQLEQGVAYRIRYACYRQSNNINWKGCGRDAGFKPAKAMLEHGLPGCLVRMIAEAAHGSDGGTEPGLLAKVYCNRTAKRLAIAHSAQWWRLVTERTTRSLNVRRNET